ncbi:MAG: hypothetical protein DVS81_06360 [Candidatus Accumulibacter meliphilus]|jgi:hypothetical protein|uniref:Uncharacterized protein n=1 Tax=Candidatus Accumulibacter meliphilus TaxID=2211374 RepID=A0A369XMH0_9PROT|nr:MAG: hypothetical protein DVS81_06360 [Candidatus Accumulibacter meliphilus]
MVTVEQGVLQLALTWNGRQILAAGVASTRPLAARALRGFSFARVLEFIPRLFSLCRCAQEVAARLCLSAARGQRPTIAATPAQTQAVALEVIGEHLWRLLLDWPSLHGEPSRQNEFLLWRKQLLGLADAGDGTDGRGAAAFGARLLAWLDHQGPPRCEERMLAAPVALLSRLSAADWESHFGDDGFVERPTLSGEPAETGVLARQAEDPEVAALLSDGRRLQARLQARYADLRELAQGLTEAEQRSTWIDVLEVAEGCGLARVETARGTLLHRVELDGDRVARYAIVAPTEWNFHPQGAFVREMTGRPAATRAEAALAARRLALALDPCVPFAVTVKDA